MILWITLIASFLMLMTKSPIVMGIILSFQGLFLSLTISLSCSSTWLSFLLFIVSLGGVLVVFLYVIITLPVGVHPSMKKAFLFLTTWIPLMYPMMKSDEEFSESVESSEADLINSLDPELTSFLVCYTSTLQLKYSIFLMLLLFIIMVVVIYLSRKPKGMTKGN